MLFSSRIAVLVVLGIVFVAGGFLLDATGANSESAVISVLVVVGLLALPIGVWVFKKVKGGRY